MAVLLLVVAFAITLLIILNSRRWVHYVGAASERDERPGRRPLHETPERPASVRRRRFLLGVANHSC